MELRDYLAALRRRWLTWAVIFAISVGTALVAIQTLPRSYQATAQIFVGTTSESTSGFQFVGQRVKSYPDIAESPAVLRPVIEALGLEQSFEEVRRSVSASNPVDTTRVEIAVTSEDPEQAAAISNAVAEGFAETVVDLEQGASEVSPVTLTVTSPATVPTSPVSPVPHLLLALGVVFGLCVGAAVAILRDRTDSTLHTEDQIRRAWGPGGSDLTVLAPASGSARRSRLIGRPATLLARRLQLLAERQPVRVLLLSASGADAGPRRLATDVANELRDAGTSAIVVAAQPDAQPSTPAGQAPLGDRLDRVRLTTRTALAPLSDLRVYAGRDAAVVIVVRAGQMHAAELPEIRRMLDALGIEPLSVVLLPAGGGRALGVRPTPRGPADVPLERLTGDRPALEEQVAAPV